MRSLDCFFEGDRFEVIKDCFDIANRKIASIGEKGTIVHPQFGEYSHITTALDNKYRHIDLPSWNLKIVEKNKKAREEYIQKYNEMLAKKEKLNLSVGSVATIKEFGFSKTNLINIIITEIKENMVYGYRINNKGERYKGRRGEIDSFLISSLLTQDEIEQIKNEIAEKKKRDEKWSPYKVGRYVPHLNNWGILSWIGVVTKVTPRTIIIDWGNNPYKFKEKHIIKEFRNGVDEKEQVEKIIQGWGVTKGVFNRLQELGFDITEGNIRTDYIE